jgi:hypothetical protein
MMTGAKEPVHREITASRKPCAGRSRDVSVERSPTGQLFCCTGPQGASAHFCAPSSRREGGNVSQKLGQFMPRERGLTSPQSSSPALCAIAPGAGRSNTHRGFSLTRWRLCRNTDRRSNRTMTAELFERQILNCHLVIARSEATSAVSAVARRAKAESNPCFSKGGMDCFAPLAMTRSFRTSERRSGTLAPGRVCGSYRGDHAVLVRCLPGRRHGRRASRAKTASRASAQTAQPCFTTRPRLHLAVASGPCAVGAGCAPPQARRPARPW